MSADLKDVQHQGKSAFVFQGKSDEWWLIRQKVFHQWQRSVASYRAPGGFEESRILLRTALEIAKKLERRPEGLLTQLYFGAGKLEFQKGNYDKAASFYRESILNASSGPATAKEEKATDEEVQIEKNAAQYSVGKAMALGLSQCLREQGRLEEAYPIVVAEVFLLEKSGDLSLIRHAQQTQASIERGTAAVGPYRFTDHGDLYGRQIEYFCSAITRIRTFCALSSHGRSDTSALA